MYDGRQVMAKLIWQGELTRGLSGLSLCRSPFILLWGNFTEPTEPSIGASHQVSIHLVKQFQRRRFLEIDQPEIKIAYGSHVC